MIIHGVSSATAILKRDFRKGRKNMPDQEADILEVFVAGFRAGKMTTMAELGYEQPRNPPMQMVQS
mgnify:CR=1 FL=1